MSQYTCTKGKDGRLYVFKINENGKKVRTKNEFVKQCGIKIPECKRLCNKTSPAKKINTPCMKKKGLFLNKLEVKDYCKHKPAGDYSRKDRQKIADIYNQVLRGEMSESKGEKLLKKYYKK